MKKVKANALQYTLIVGVVIFVFILTILLYFHLNTLIGVQTQEKIDVIQKQQLLFYHSNNSSLNHSTWGAFQVSTTKPLDVKNLEGLNYAAITAKPWYKGDLPELYLKDTNSYFQISGDTKLEGNLVVPDESIRTTNVAGRLYNGRTTTNLTLKSSSEQLPRHNLTNINYQFYTDQDSDSLISKLPDQLKHSFFKPTVVYRSPRKIELINHQLTGNIKLVSDQKIIVHSESFIKDILLVAPIIEIKNRFEGNVQMVARDSITIGNNSKLEFPSSALIPESKNETKIILKEKSMFSGCVVQLNEIKLNRIISNLDIKKSSVVNGVVYNSGLTYLKGSVEGSITTSGFLAYEKGSTYRNYVIDGKILQSKNTDFVSLFNRDHKNYSPIKWLY